jgi:hypothetical protein
MPKPLNQQHEEIGVISKHERNKHPKKVDTLLEALFLLIEIEQHLADNLPKAAKQTQIKGLHYKIE